MVIRIALAALAAAALWPTSTLSQDTAPKPSFEAYGHAQLDYIYDFNRVDPNWQATLRPSKIPTADGVFGSDGQSIFSVRQSRLAARTALPVAGDVVKARIEFDFFGVGPDAGQTTIRLRHAYGEWHGLLVGQTWTTFMDPDVIPNVLDYFGPNGRISTRREQIRWSPVLGDLTFSVAAERPGQDVDVGVLREVDPSVAENIQSDQKIPDFVAAVRMKRGFGHVQLAGILRRLQWDTADTADNQPKGHATGWGLAATSRVNLLRKDRLLLSVSGGEGIAAVMNDAGVDVAAEGQVGSASGTGVPIYGVMAWYEHVWNDLFTSAVGYSGVWMDNTNLQAGSAFKSGQYASANLLWTPAKNVLMGPELLWGRREDKSGATGDDVRIQLSARFSFSSNDVLAR
jgi:hypothetical protein